MGAGGRMPVPSSSKKSETNAIKRVPCEKPPFTVGDLKKAIPPQCFKRSIPRSFSYLITDIIIASCFYYVATNYFSLLPQPLSLTLLGPSTGPVRAVSLPVSGSLPTNAVTMLSATTNGWMTQLVLSSTPSSSSLTSPGSTVIAATIPTRDLLKGMKYLFQSRNPLSSGTANTLTTLLDVS